MSKIKAGVLERDGAELDGLEEIDTINDYVSAKGIVFQNSDNHKIDTSDNEIVFTDPINSAKKLSTLLQAESHRVLDQLVHNVSENTYLEVTRVEGKVSVIIWWLTPSKNTKVREIIYNRSGGKLSSVITKQYNDGVLAETYTETITRTGDNVSSISGVLS